MDQLSVRGRKNDATGLWTYEGVLLSAEMREREQVLRENIKSSILDVLSLRHQLDMQGEVSSNSSGEGSGLKIQVRGLWARRGVQGLCSVRDPEQGY